MLILLEVLASLDDQISKAKEEAFSRKEIMEKMEKWMSSCEEESWLEDYGRVNFYATQILLVFMRMFY